MLRVTAGQTMKNQAFWRRLAFAVVGIRATIRSEASFRAQLLLGLAAAVVLALVRPPLIWLAMCFMSASVVLALELVNTALEHLADRLHPERHIAIQRAKDCAAAAVLLASIAAVVIGGLTVAVGLGWLRN
jgi:undecaprenol kinase